MSGYLGSVKRKHQVMGGTAKNIYWMSIVKYRLRVTNINFRKQREIEEWMRKVERKKKAYLERINVILARYDFH